MHPHVAFEEMSDEVGLVQPLHDDDNASALLVVEATDGVRSCHSLARVCCTSDTASSNFTGSSMTRKSAPRPAKTPPTKADRPEAGFARDNFLR